MAGSSLKRYVALLRGINVGGNNKLPMADLRAALEADGYHDVATYIQSGNVALSAAACDADDLTRMIQREFDLTIPVVVRSEKQLATTIANNPFPDLETEPKRLLVYFSGTRIPKNWDRDFDYAKYEPDRVSAGPSEIYVGYREGVSASKLTNPVLDRAIGASTTARNWNTVLKLAEMAAG